MADTIWCGTADDKVYLQSGMFTSTIKDSVDVSSISTAPGCVSYDDNPAFSHFTPSASAMMLDGFSTTILTSIGQSTTPNCASVSTSRVNVEDTIVLDSNISKDTYQYSGQMTSTIKATVDVGGITSRPNGISVNNVDSYLSDDTVSVAKEVKISGIVATTTIKDSVDIESTTSGLFGGGLVDADTDDFLSAGSNGTDDKLWHYANMSTTITDSEDVGAIDTVCNGIDTTDQQERLVPSVGTRRVIVGGVTQKIAV